MGNDLWQLCARYGIATDYHDIFGHRHVVPPTNLITLLESFGVAPNALLSWAGPSVDRVARGIVSAPTQAAEPPRARPEAVALDARPR